MAVDAGPVASSPLRQVLRREEGPSSEVLEVLDVATNQTYRNMHLVSFQPITKALLSASEKAAERYIGMFQLTYEAAGTARRIRVSYEMSDTQVNRLIALRTLQEVAIRPDMPTGTSIAAADWKPRPTAIVGGAASSVSLALANLAGIYQIPQISGTSSATALEDKLAAPYFSRTYPTNQADAEALMVYYKSIGVTHFGLIFGRDLYGQGFGQAVIQAAARHDIEIKFFAYEIVKDGFQPLKEGLQFLASTKVRYFFAVLHYESYKAAFREAYNLGIMGHPGYVWTLGDNNAELTTDDFTLDNETESDIAKAIHGVGVLLPGIEIHPVIADVMTNQFKTNQQLQRDFVAAHQSNLHHYFDDINFANNSMLPSFYAGMVYDAAMTAMLAACDIQDTGYFSSEQLLDAMRQQAFQGATGYVTFNNITGTRDLLGLRYTITNVLVAEESQQLTPGRIHFNATKRIGVEFPSDVIDLGEGPFIFSDNSATPPEALPPREVNLNLIPKGVQAFGWSLAAFIIVLSLRCMVFTYWNRDKRAVKAHQPEFLFIISFGCLLLACAVIPMSFQEPISQSVLDRACMSQLYLVCLGFCVSFSALYCKLYRINKLLKGAKNFRRVKVDVKDVLYPLVIMVTLNLVVLICWQVLDPLTWRRLPTKESQDGFGRDTSTYAQCSSINRHSEVIFGCLLFAINFVALLSANWEGYQGRNLPSQFNEAGRIAMSMFFLIESVLLGMPILLVVQNDPTGAFHMASRGGSVSLPFTLIRSGFDGGGECTHCLGNESFLRFSPVAWIILAKATPSAKSSKRRDAIIQGRHPRDGEALRPKSSTRSLLHRSGRDSTSAKNAAPVLEGTPGEEERQKEPIEVESSDAESFADEGLGFPAHPSDEQHNNEAVDVKTSAHDTFENEGIL
ncbi:acid type B receptor subunit 2 [Seminavis robusta]|uniref:Acid type B receptor subunit 2 n=1 Tax=Seminavis robusta TaxID=568900 RepID=A0A9N8D451_9STRA|nr:acid type B receptor subunit 2 [Seminavis robusta]|eukprot:Sro1_g000460.1 acid type B receptor subunit 2 (906) ;mRNA; r:133813-136666